MRSPAALAALAAALLLAACPGSESDAGAAAATTPRAGFDGNAAYGYVKAQLAMGPRVPGTEGHRRTGDWIVAQLRRSADTVVVQEWTHRTAKGDSLPMRNILARFRPDAAERVLYLAHWDTRPVADAETDARKKTQPIPGANDGASGVALLVALSDALKKAPPDVGVDLLLVDGEDYGDFDRNEDVFIGSTYFADHLPTERYQPLYGILFDMVGDRDLQIYQEINSAQAAPEVVQRVWRQAADLGYDGQFIPRTKWAITDDHIPLLKKGLRVIDVIDFDYDGHHHKLSDDIDQVSARSLQIVGDVALSLVRN